MDSKLKLYGANWCGDCRRAKKFLGDQPGGERRRRRGYGGVDGAGVLEGKLIGAWASIEAYLFAKAVDGLRLDSFLPCALASGIRSCGFPHEPEVADSRPCRFVRVGSAVGPGTR